VHHFIDFQQHGPSKTWPPALDESLREVDKAVVAAHPQGWRLNAYLSHLMQFLPYGKTTLRGHMVRLDAQDVAQVAKQEKERAWEALKTHVIDIYIYVYLYRFDGETYRKPNVSIYRYLSIYIDIDIDRYIHAAKTPIWEICTDD
jgi:hypothetical protein